MESAPTFLDPAKAGEAIRAKVDAKTPLTVADASARTGLALRDAESGLKWLSSEYRGQLRVTNDGELVHVFPTGFAKPWEGRDARRQAVRAVGHALAGAMRFIVRAWVAVVLVSYAAIFLALVIGMTFARQGNDSSSRRDGLPGGALAYGFLRVVGDALFWTFHPWSPFAVGYGNVGWGGGLAPRRARSEGPKVPLYERVNRFFFGPTAPPDDPRENERLILSAIRAGKGRIGLADVMRVTGLPREKADPLMARLMLDYEGEVDVSEDGGIVYRFAAIRKTAAETTEREPPPAWSRSKPLPPLTGNPPGANFAIAAINAFNLFMGLWAIENDMTLERAIHLFDKVPYHVVGTGVPIALGIVPLVFSALLFLLPVGRALLRPVRAKAATEEKGRLAVLHEVLDRVRLKQPVTDAGVAAAWKSATGEAPPGKRLDRDLVALGGDVAIEESGATKWRFPELETEAAAVEAERQAAAEDEARLGPIVYATDEG
ncbi:MAG TPA: hypothetical protein VGL81_15465 [Polyangiaceae bacterium]